MNDEDFSEEDLRSVAVSGTVSFRFGTWGSGVRV